MLTNYLKIAARVLLRNKLYTVINIVGLSLGIACAILILLFVRNELTYDSSLQHGDAIFRIAQSSKKANNETKVSAFVPIPLGPALRAEYPEILHVARFTTGGVIVSEGGKSFPEEVGYTDPDFFSMFDVKFLGGSPVTALHSPNDIVITKEMAARYFGTEAAVGRTLLVRTRNAEEPFTVAGVVEPMPVNSSVQFDFLANVSKRWMYEKLKDSWSWSNGSVFVQLPEGMRGEELEQKLAPFVQRHFGADIEGRRNEGVLSKEPGSFRLELEPLAAMHFDTKVVSPEEKGNPAYSMILGAIGLFVLAIACINFVTLAIGRSANRAREVGMRKVLGAVRTQLMMQFWGEAALLSAFAMGLGLAIAELFLPTFNQLTGTKLTLSVIDVGLAGALVILLLVVSVAAGSYPAAVLSRFEPVDVLKGKFRLGGKSFFTKALVVFQFALSIVLVCVASILSDQIHFMVTANLGFQSQHVAILPTFADAEDAERIAERFRSRVQENPDILSVAATSGAFTHGYDISGFKYNNEVKNSYVYRIDDRYLETLKIQLLEGRNFTKGSADDRNYGMIVNEAFLRHMGWSMPALGKRLEGSDDKGLAQLHVIGVVKDFHFRSFREQIEPAIMLMRTDWPLDDFLIRISPSSIPRTVEYLRQVWKELRPNTPFELTFMDDDFQKLYEAEMRWEKIITTSTIFAVFLAALGLFGLATLAVTNRTKEIGIRKVLGASGAGMVNLISGDFLKLVLIANLIAWPVAYFIATKFLELYAYRITLSPWTFVLAGCGALMISFLTILGQIIRAVRANVVEALRYE